MMRPSAQAASTPADDGAPSPQVVKDPGPRTPAGSSEWTEDRAGTATGLLAFAGIALLVIGELSDRLESDLGLGAVNLCLAALLAALTVSVSALLGDTLVGTIARRSGRRPSHSSMTALLMLAGAPTAVGIWIVHRSHPLALDSWIALTGSVLLVIAALAHHQLPQRLRGRL